MTRFVLLYSGPTRDSARLICSTADPRAVASVAKAALRSLTETTDTVLRHLTTGRREALQEIIGGGGKN